MEVYDVMGRITRTLLDETIPAGGRVVTWDTRDQSDQTVRSGMYYVRLNFEGGVRLATIPVVR